MGGSTTKRFTPPTRPLEGIVYLPGDKSMSHRAVMFAGAAEKTSRLYGILDSEDVRATRSAMEQLGASLELRDDGDGTLEGSIIGWGKTGPVREHLTIDCGNSGTTARLLMGLLGGAGVDVTLTGDDSLSSRPMERVAKPLREMGCEIELSPEGTLPAHITPPKELRACTIDTGMSSAQVKSAILLAGLFANGTTTVIESAPSRDHTENMLTLFGVPVQRDGQLASSVKGPTTLYKAGFTVPGDPSSAAFFAVATAMIPGSAISLKDISLNPTRIGFLEVMKRMGVYANIQENPHAQAERCGTVVVNFTPNLSGCSVSAEEIPSLIDEIPILALLATTAATETRFASVGELRVKESDRLQAIIDGINALGGRAYADGDDLVIAPQKLSHGATLDSLGDHRLAMTWAVAGLTLDDGVEIKRFDAVDVSFPHFTQVLSSL